MAVDKKLKYYAKKLNQDAPEGEFLAYINKKESNLLKRKGGLGIKTRSGIPSYIGSDASGQGGGGTGAGPGDASDSDSGGGKGKGGDPDNNREQYGAVGQYSSTTSSSSPKGGEVDRPNPHTVSGTSKTSTVTGKQMKSAARDFVQTLNTNNAIRAAQTKTKFSPFDNFTPTFAPTVKTPWDRVKQIFSIASVLSPHTLVGKIGLGLTTYDKVKTGLETVTSIADTFGINTDSITNSLSNNFSGKKSNTTTNTNTNNGGDGEGLASLENQASGYDEYILLLQKLQSGNITDSERNRYNVLKNMLGI